jgi:hypothetical protein
MKKVGRPSTFTQEVADTICGRLAEGESLRSICSDDDMPSKTTVCKWLASDAHPGFADQYARAREAQADHEFDGLCALADEPPEKKPDGSVDPGWVQHQKLRIDTRKWALSKLAPKKYGDKIAVGGADDLPPIKTAPPEPGNGLAREIAYALQLGLKSAADDKSQTPRQAAS